MQHDMKDLFARALIDEPPASVDIERAVAYGRRQHRLVVGGRAVLGAAAAGVAALTIGVLAPALSTQGNDVAVSAPNAVSSPPAQDPLVGRDLSGASAAQAAVIADRIVTDQEYRAAFDRYSSCMQNRHGWTLGDVKMWHGGIFWTVTKTGTKSPSGIEERCYPTEYMFVEMLRLFAMDDSPQTTQLLRECLQSRGWPTVKTRAGLNEGMKATGPNLGGCEASRQRLNLPPLVQ